HLRIHCPDGPAADGERGIESARKQDYLFPARCGAETRRELAEFADLIVDLPCSSAAALLRGHFLDFLQLDIRFGADTADTGGEEGRGAADRVAERVQVRELERIDAVVEVRRRDRGRHQVPVRRERGHEMEPIPRFDETYGDEIMGQN